MKYYILSDTKNLDIKENTPQTSHEIKAYKCYENIL